MRLPEELLRAGDRLLHFPIVVSTMDEARVVAASIGGERLWIVADQQSGGRGRQGRVWHSPAGNLYVTLVMRAPCALREQPKLGFVAGMALCAAVRSLIKAPQDVSLKWPNDLLLGDAKVSGLLLEGLEHGEIIAIGMGVNIAAFPKDTPYAAAALGKAIPELTAPALFERLALAMVEELRHFGDGSGFPLIRQRWLACAAHLNESITVRNGESIQSGVFKDIDLDGRLILETGNGMIRIDAGDVFPLDK